MITFSFERSTRGSFLGIVPHAVRFAGSKLRWQASDWLPSFLLLMHY